MSAPSIRRSVAGSRGRAHRPSDRTILVVDGHVAFAEALASVLDDVPGLQAVEATTIAEAQRALDDREVDMVLLELDVNGDDGIRFVREARAEQPDLRIIAVTASKDDNRVVEAVRVGISGWVPKDEPIEHLVSVVDGVLRGETWIPPRLLTHVLAELFSAQREASGLTRRLTTLSKREREVLDCLTRGMQKDEIARQLCVSRNTLRTHIQNILGKLGVHSILAAVALARRAEIAQAESFATTVTRIRPKR